MTGTDGSRGGCHCDTIGGSVTVSKPTGSGLTTGSLLRAWTTTTMTKQETSARKADMGRNAENGKPGSNDGKRGKPTQTRHTAHGTQHTTHKRHDTTTRYGTRTRDTPDALAPNVVLQ